MRPLLSYSRDEFLATDWMSLTHQDDLADNLRSSHMRQRDGAEGGIYEKRLIRKDGGAVLCEPTDAIITDPKGEASYFITHLRDITGKRVLEALLAQSQKMDAIGQLTGGIAHDFNNLLSVISNYTGFAIEELKEQSLIEDLHHVSEAADRAARLVRQLLSFSRKRSSRP